MKKSILLLLQVMLFVAVMGQTVSLKVKDQPISKVLREIEKQTDYRFVYAMDVVRNAKPVTFETSKESVHAVLEKIFLNQPLKYEFNRKTVIVSPKPSSQKQEPSGEPGYKNDIAGIVLNENGEPVAGASVSVKGTEKSIATGADGRFVLSGVSDRAVLIVSSIGYEARSIKLAGESSIIIKLSVTAQEMKEVVVMNTGYQQVPQERATGSFEQISAKKFNQQISTDILSRLEGMSGSVLIDRRALSPSGNSIAAGNVIIRGLSTITESIKTPLIILNNFPYEGDISNINPNDVESITILKDAAAASIWGARAGNGVIVITTKKGNYNQRTRLTITSNVKITEKPDLFKLPSMSSSDFIDLERFLFDEGFYDSDVDPSNTTRPAISPVVEILNQQRRGELTEEKAGQMIDALRNNDVRNDFEKYIYRKMVSQQYAISLTGGSQNVRYALSAGYDKVLTALQGNENSRITVRSDNTFNIVKNLEFDFSLGISSVNATNNAIGELGTGGYNYYNQFPAKSLYPYAKFADENGTPLVVPHDYRLSYLQSLSVPGLLDWQYRPLDEIRMSDNTSRLQDFLLNAGINYKIIPGLTARFQYQFEKSTGKNSNYYSKETYYARNLINLFSSWDGTRLKNNIPVGGILINNPSELTAHSFRGQVNFDKVFNGKHQVAALAGAEAREREVWSESNGAYGFNKESNSVSLVNYDSLYSLFEGLGDGVRRIPAAVGFTTLTDRFVSLFMNASYAYDNRITVSGSVRRDASNLFGVETNNKWKPLWSAGLSWEISNEHFYHVDAFPYLRLRATYGYRGNVNNALSRYTTITRYPAGGSLLNLPFAEINVPADPSLRWESVGDLNLGFDFRTKSSRVGGSIEWFRKYSKDLVSGALLDPATGLNAVEKNSASLITNGVQVDINSINITGPVKWTTQLAFSYTASRIKDYFLDDKGRSITGIAGAKSGIILVRDKDPYGIYSLPFAGLDPENGDPLGYLGGKTSKDYRGMLQQSIDTANLTYHGSGLPRYYGFLNNTFSYKGLSLTVNILYQFDFYFRKFPLDYYQLVNNGVVHPDYEKRWQKPGDEAFTTVPSLRYPLPSQNRDRFYNASSVNVLKGDNIRLQYVRLSYEIDKAPFGWKAMEGLQLSLIASDLGFIRRANKEKLDPAFGASNIRYAVPKSYALGLKLSF